MHLEFYSNVFDKKTAEATNIMVLNDDGRVVFFAQEYNPGHFHISACDDPDKLREHLRVNNIDKEIVKLEPFKGLKNFG